MKCLVEVLISGGKSAGIYRPPNLDHLCLASVLLAA